MLTFIFYTILFWLAGAGICKAFYLAIQPTNVLDVLLKWQKLLNWLYGKGAYGQLLEKGLGGCEQCYCSTSAVLWFICYCLFMSVGLDRWVADMHTLSGVIVNVVWYLVFYGIQWAVNMKVLTGKIFG